MKKLFCFLFFVACFYQSNAQQDSINLAAKIAFFSPVDVFNFPTIDLSLEKKFGHRFSISAEGGYEIYHFFQPDTSFIHPGGYKAKLEMRIYHPFSAFSKRDYDHPALTGFYVGIDFFYRSEKYNSQVDYTTAKNRLMILHDDFWNEKSAEGGTLIFGNQDVVKRKIVIDEFASIGILNRKIQYHELEYSEENGDRIENGGDLSTLLSRGDLHQHNGLAPAFSVGVRIGYVIN